MLKALLIERFHLKVHMETRSGTVLRLLPAKSGLKLKPLGDQAAVAGQGELKPGNLVWDDSGSASEGNTALPADSNAPARGGALEKQLDLRLESGYGPVPTLVIGHVERPAGN